MRYTVLLIVSTICAQIIHAQRGGSNTYDFLNLTNSARVAALGGNNISISDEDMNIAFHNPALLNKEMDKQAILNLVPFVAEINYGSFGYSFHKEELGSFALGINFIDYGSFTKTTEYQEILGKASASEYSLNLSYARKLSPKTSMAMSLKPIYSVFDVYKSFGFATDFGFHYKSSNALFSFGAVLKNVGAQIVSYDDVKEKIPSDLQIGFTKKLSHAPFRFSLTAQDLLSWDLSYKIADENSSNNLKDAEDITFSDNLFRHLVIGVEFLPAKNFHVDFGYNYKRRKELSYAPRMSTVGWSWGFGFRIYKFLFSYGSSKHHLGGSSNHFSLSTNFGK